MGPRAKRAQEAEPMIWARPLSRGCGGGGGASECFLRSCCYTWALACLASVVISAIRVMLSMAGLPCCAGKRVCP